ncbi:16422_t:CDS:2, partial [Gigaspora margarita]
PMDAGIINAFKAHYKRDYIHKVICDFDIDIEKPYKIDVLQAILLVKDAHLDKIFLEFEMITENIETQNIQVSEVIVAQYEAQDIIDLTHDTDI